MADIKIYGRLVNATTEAEIAQAEQIVDHAYDGGKGKKQSDINAELKAAINGVDGKKFKTINGETITGEGDITIDLSLYKVVTALPTEGIDDKKIYLVKNAAGKDNDVYTEYVYVTADKKWEKLGEYKSTVDLTDYAKTADVDAKVKTVNDALTAHKQDAVAHITAAERTKWNALKNYTLPAATETDLGGVVISPEGGLSVDEDGTLKVKRGAGNEVIEFGGIEDGDVTIEQQSFGDPSQVEKVVYNPTKGGFLFKDGSDFGAKYYMNWQGAEAWGEEVNKFWQAVAGTLYVDVTDNKVYRFDGTGLVEVAAQGEAAALTDAEIDEICK